MSTLMQAFHDLKPQRIEIGKLYPAIVVENKDKSKLKDKLPLGRVKFRIPTLFDGIDDEFLPWALPRFMRYKGGKNNGEFSVPKIGAKIFVEFQSNDVYNPFYTSYPYIKDETLDILTKESVDDDEYPKKHVIYSFDSGNVFTINDDYADEDLKYKLYLKNVGNVQVWCGKNYDHYVKDNYDLVVDGKYEVHAVPASTTVIVRNKHFFNAHQDSVSVYSGRETVQVQGRSNHTYFDRAERHFARGALISVSKGNLIIDIPDESKILVSSKGDIAVVTEKNISVIGDEVTVEAQSQLRLRGEKITKSVEIDFEDGRSTKEEIQKMIDAAIEAFKSEVSSMIDSAVSEASSSADSSSSDSIE